MTDRTTIVIPAKAGIQWRSYKRRWIPAFAGMTNVGCRGMTMWRFRGNVARFRGNDEMKNCGVNYI